MDAMIVKEMWKEDNSNLIWNRKVDKNAKGACNNDCIILLSLESQDNKW